jgi:hypothetical protein
MSYLTHYLTETEREAVGDALYHEGLGYLNRREFVSNVANIIGSPGEEPRVLEIIEAVLDGTYRNHLNECDKPDCYCH